MNQAWKKSIWVKYIAACFIGLIVLGNIWLVMRFSTSVAPLWLQTSFAVLTGAVFLFGAALLAEQFLRKLGEVDQAQIEREASEDLDADHK